VLHAHAHVAVELSVLAIRPTVVTKYCESTFISWHQFSWFLQNTLIHVFLISWFQTLQAIIIGENVFCWIFIFVV
jgi:hypothetical protein